MNHHERSFAISDLNERIGLSAQMENWNEAFVPGIAGEYYALSACAIERRLSVARRVLQSGIRIIRQELRKPEVVEEAGLQK